MKISESHDMRRPEVVCVLGMHRSGTSLLSRTLNLIGVDLGPAQQLTPADGNNPTGYWEHGGITSLNDEILRRFGGSWDDPPEFPPAWESAAAMDDLKQRARRMIQNSFAGSDTWGWKDPRGCLTLPFWQQLLPDMRYVVCLRNPVDVALSLQQRDRFAAEKSSRLWLTYVSSALKHSEGRPRLTIFHEDLMENCIGELQRLAVFLGKPARAGELGVQEAVQSFVEKDLQHYSTSLVQSMGSPEIDCRARALYIAQRISARFGQASNGQVTADGRIEKVLEILSDSFSAPHRARPLQERLAERDGQMAESRHAIRALATRLAAKEKELEASLAQLLNSETKLARIANSTAWRLLKRGRRIRRRYLKPIFRLLRRAPAESAFRPEDRVAPIRSASAADPVRGAVADRTPATGLCGGRESWNDIPGWFSWRSAQEEAAREFPDGSRFVEVGNFLGRSLCSLGEIVASGGKCISLIGVDTCLGSGVEGPRYREYHGAAVAEGGGTFAGMLHKNIVACGYEDLISLIVADSVTAATFFPDQSIDWVHLDARHDREGVSADIRAWLPKVKAGGWLSGDDYDEVKWPEVVDAVSELLPGARPWSIHQWRWVVPRAALQA